MVRMVRLPDASDGAKQGVDDFLATGGTVEELVAFSDEYSEADRFEEDWPILAEEAYHGIIGELVRAVEPNTESDPAGLVATLIAELGNVFGRGAHWLAEGDTHYCKVNAVLVGDTSKGRKGTGQGRIDALMRRVDSGWCARCVTTGLSSGEGLIHNVRDNVVREKKDGTVEVVDEGVSDKRLLVQEPEFASPLTVMRREGNTLSMVVRNAWDDKPLKTLTKHSGEESTGSHVTIIGHITKAELLRHLTEEKLGGGIANRFLFVLVGRSKVLPLGGGEDEISNEQIIQLRRGVEFGQKHRRLELSEEVEESYGYSAKELWFEVYPDLSEGKHGLFGAVVSRAEANVRRIATIYAAMDRSKVVKVPHLLAALAVWDYAEDSAALIFGKRLGDEVADEIMESLWFAAEDGMSRTDIYNLFGRHQKAKRIGAILRELEVAGKIRMEKSKSEGPGRPVQRWFIHDD